MRDGTHKEHTIASRGEWRFPMCLPKELWVLYSTYDSIDDRIDDFHYHTTWIKFGIGRATYDSSQEVRNGDLTRQEAIALIHKYDGEYPSRWVDEIFQYLSINSKEFLPLQNYLKKVFSIKNTTKIYLINSNHLIFGILIHLINGI